MVITTETAELRHKRCCHHMSWTAIIVGTLVAIGLGFLFSLFNVGIGLSAFTMDPQTMTNIAIVGYIWLIISAIIVFFIAGMVTGRLGSYYHTHRCSGFLYGFVTWCLALIVTLCLMPRLNTLMPSNVSNVNLTTISNPTPSVVQTAPSDTKIVVNTEKTTNTIGKVTLATFVIFLLGAIASGIGGLVGIRTKHHHNDVEGTTETIKTNRPIPPIDERPVV